MSGAYTAKPAAAVPRVYPEGYDVTLPMPVPPIPTTPDLWDWDWAFPGPTPPGYEWQDYDFAADGVPANGAGIPGIWVSPIETLHTNEHDDGVWSEEYGSYFWVCLTASPTLGSITVPFVSGDYEKAACEPTSYEFSMSNWYIPQKVKLVGHNDEHIDGDVDFTVVIGPTDSSYVPYSGLYGHDVDGTSYEIVNKIQFTVCNITGYGSIASQTFRGVEEADYVEIHATIYSAPPGTAALETFVNSGVVVVDGWTRYYADGTKLHGGSATNTSFTALTVEADVTETYSYACVSSIKIGGKVGTTDGITCKGRIYFYHDDILLEDYFAADTHQNADIDQYFGMPSYWAHAFLHNADTEAATKLEITTANYIKTEETAWSVEVAVSDLSTAGGPQTWATAAVSNDAHISNYAAVDSIDGGAAVATSSGSTYSVDGTYLLKQESMIRDLEEVANVSAFISTGEGESGSASLTLSRLDVYFQVGSDDVPATVTKIRKYSYAEDAVILAVSGSGTQEDCVIRGFTFDIDGNLTTVIY